MGYLNLDTIRTMRDVANELGINFLLDSGDEANIKDREYKVNEWYLILAPTQRDLKLNESGGLFGVSENFLFVLGRKNETKVTKTGGVNSVNFGRYEKNIEQALELFEMFIIKLIGKCKHRVTNVRIGDGFEFYDTSLDVISVELEVSK